MKKFKNKKRIICSIILVCVCILGIGCFYGIKQLQEKKLLKEIQSHYYLHASVNKNAVIYIKEKEKYQKVGTLKKGLNITLDKLKIEKINRQYFKIDGSNYYIYYEDVAKGKKISKKDYPYLLFNKNVKTNKKTSFYQDKKRVISLRESMNLPLMYMDQEYYYVTYLDQIFGIKRTESTLADHQNTKDKEAHYISVLHYGQIYKEGESCKEATCISEKQVTDQINILKEQGFYTISVEELKRWLEGSIQLKEKAVLLTVGKETDVNDQFNVINEQTPLKFEDKNKKVTLEYKVDAVPRYIIKNNTSNADYKKMLKGEEVKEVVPSTTNSVNLTGNATQIAVLNYHFFYDSSIGETCEQSICLDTAKFEEQLKYLKDHGWKTLTMEEFRAWMYGEIELPAKSVLLTVDDGGMGTGKSNGNKLIPLLEKYQAHATIFLITAWYFPPDYQSPYLDIESHTHEMHTEGLCSGVPRGAQMLCSTKEQVLEDLKKSISVTGSKKAFCYPFYAYNDAAVEAVRESGFALGFQGGGYKATRASNKMLIPRYAIQQNITMSTFINMIS